MGFSGETYNKWLRKQAVIKNDRLFFGETDRKLWVFNKEQLVNLG